jgi:hypothetical protein
MIWLQIVINSAEYATGLGKLIAHHAMEWEEEVKAELIMTGKTILFTEMSGCLATLVTGAILPVTDVVEAGVLRNNKGSNLNL